MRSVCARRSGATQQRTNGMASLRRKPGSPTARWGDMVPGTHADEARITRQPATPGALAAPPADAGTGFNCPDTRQSRRDLAPRPPSTSAPGGRMDDRRYPLDVSPTPPPTARTAWPTAAGGTTASTMRPVMDDSIGLGSIGQRPAVAPGASSRLSHPVSRKTRFRRHSRGMMPSPSSLTRGWRDRSRGAGAATGSAPPRVSHGKPSPRSSGVSHGKPALPAPGFPVGNPGVRRHPSNAARNAATAASSRSRGSSAKSSSERIRTSPGRAVTFMP